MSSKIKKYFICVFAVILVLGFMVSVQAIDTTVITEEPLEPASDDGSPSKPEHPEHPKHPDHPPDHPDHPEHPNHP